LNVSSTFYWIWMSTNVKTLASQCSVALNNVS